MSFYDYEASKEIAAKDYPFAALIMAAMRKADGHNIAKLLSVYPDIWEELEARYNAPGGRILGERGSICPGREDPRCKGLCTIDMVTFEIVDPDCFRRPQ